MVKKKINDDTLLQFIRDGNSPAGLETPISALEENTKSRLLLSPAASQKIGREHEASNALSRCYPRTRNAVRVPSSLLSPQSSVLRSLFAPVIKKNKIGDINEINVLQD